MGRRWYTTFGVCYSRCKNRYSISVFLPLDCGILETAKRYYDYRHRFCQMSRNARDIEKEGRTIFLSKLVSSTSSKPIAIDGDPDSSHRKTDKFGVTLATSRPTRSTAARYRWKRLGYFLGPYTLNENSTFPKYFHL